MNLYVIKDVKKDDILACNFFKNDAVAIDIFEQSLNSFVAKSLEIKKQNGFCPKFNKDNYVLCKCNFSDIDISSSDVLIEGKDIEISVNMEA